MNRPTLACLALLALAPALAASRVKLIEKSTLADFQKGSFVNVSIDSDGRMSLGPKLKAIAGPAEEFYLSAAVGANGDLYLGTGHNASVYRVSPTGKSELLFKGEQLDVYALLVTEGGDVVAATSPNGRVVRIAKDNQVREIFNPDEKFIWDLAEDRQGNIICALGNTGAVTSISKAGSAESLFTAEDSHIVSLLVTADNAILAGSGDRGILYEIKDRKVRVLYDSPLDEIKDIVSDEDGRIYFAAVKGVPTPQATKGIEVGITFEKAEPAEKETLREKSILYRLLPGGAVETVWSSSEELIYSLYYDPATKKVLVGTGHAGRVYRVGTDGTYEQLCVSDSAQVFRIAGGGAGCFLVANNTAGITQVEPGRSASGTYFSEVFDARIPSRFGRLSWNGEPGKPSAVTLAVRLGNSDNPDRSWTAWSAPFSDPENSNINASGYRFLQAKIVLNAATPAEAPSLSGYRIHYLSDNLKPELGPILVQTPGERKPIPDTTPPPKYLLLSWEAGDPNQDRLNFKLYLQRLPGGEWTLLRDNVRDKWLYLDCELFADGKYRLKVQADDGQDNPPELAKTSARVTPPFVIDSTAPTLGEFNAAGGRISFTASDEASAVSLVQYSFDAKDWIPVLPEDKVGDSRLERFAFQPANPKGSRVLFIKLSDEFGNYKVFQKSI
jgi:sugar lactone lactonase YvrE